MLKLIVFDCDGVMFDSRHANREYYNALLCHFGQEVMDEDELEFVHIHNVADAVAHIFRNHPETNMMEVENFRKELGYGPFLKFMHMEKDLIPFLEIVSGKQHLAISTNRSDTMLPLLETFSLKGYFDKVVTPLTVKRPKPAPDGLQEILEHFNCRPEEAVFIGDSILDRQQSASCAVRLIAFKNPSLSADFHVNSFMEILQLPPFKGSR